MSTPLLKEPIEIAQLELWQGKPFMENHQKMCSDMAQNVWGAHWLLTVVSISDGHNYLFTSSDEVKLVLTDAIGAEFDGDIGVTSSLILRKEMLRELQA